MTDPRAYPDRPFLAVSAAIIHDGRVLIVRRARPASGGLYTLPGGVVEAGEALKDAVRREVREETGLQIDPVALADYREVILRDRERRVARHFVILAFAARWRGGELALNDEVSEGRWMAPPELDGLETTEGLPAVVAAAFRMLAAAR